jgi:hypothetical protein
MQGKRKVAGPFGWDDNNPEPRASWRKRNGGNAEPVVDENNLPPMPVALKFLRPVNALERAQQKRAGIKFFPYFDGKSG